jgi:hypothetical protein
VTTQAKDHATIGHSDLVSPIEDLISILDPFWDQYARARETGRTQEEAVAEALESLLSPTRLKVLTHMLAGDLDRQLSTLEVSFDGRSMLIGLISSGDRYWQQTRPSGAWSKPAVSTAELTTA